MLGHHVFDPDKTSVFLARVIDQALTEVYGDSTVSWCLCTGPVMLSTFSNMTAIVSRFNISCLALTSIFCIDVNSCQKLAYVVQRLEFLAFGSAEGIYRLILRIPDLVSCL